MEQTTAEPETNNAPVTYPERIYDSGSREFVPNVNREQSSDNLTTVLTDRNEVLGFPDQTSKQEMQSAIEADRNGSISEYKPTFYEKYIQGPLADMGIDAFQPKFVSDIKPTPERAFATSMAEAATAGVFKPEFIDQEAKANPKPAFAGSVVGSIVAFASGSALLDGWKLSQLTPFAENIIKGGILGGTYKGISETSNELRDQDHPDLAKIGQGVLHDALWWGGISGIAGAVSKPIGVAASAGLGYLMAKSDGADEPTALLNGAVLGGFHLLQTHGDQPEVRQLVTDKIQSNISDYILAKNPLVNPDVAAQAGREFVANHVEDAIEKTNNGLVETGIETPQAKEIEEGEKQKFPRPEPPIEDGYDPKLLDYLSQYIPSDRIVRMSGTDRISLGKVSESDLESYKQQYEQMAQIMANEKSEANKPFVPEVDKMINEGGPINVIDEAAKSRTILNQVMKNVTQEVMLKEGGENANSGGEGTNEGGEPAQGMVGQAQEGIRVRDNAQAWMEAGEGKEVINQQATNEKGELIAPTEEKQSAQQESKEELSQRQVSSKESIAQEEGTGEEKVRGLSKSVEESAQGKGLVDELKEKPTYKTRQESEVDKKVSDFIDKDPELAKRIALRDAPEQDGIRAEEMYTGLVKRAFEEGDVPLIHELGTSEKAASMATELGQRVQALDLNDENNPVKVIQDINKSRPKPTKSMVSDQGKTVKILKRELSKSMPKPDEWNDFIESIGC